MRKILCVLSGVAFAGAIGGLESGGSWFMFGVWSAVAVVLLLAGLNIIFSAKGRHSKF